MVARETGTGRAQKRVALLMDAIADDYQVGIVRGAASAAQQAQIDLVCFAGGVVGEPSVDARSLRNFLFEIIDVEAFDGVLALGGTLGNQIGVPALNEWMKRFLPLPLVSLGVDLNCCHNVVVHGAPGMKEMLRHLIEVHGHRRIGFIRGPLASVEAEERYAAYREVLAERGISEDPTLVVQGDWLRESGSAAVRELFDERGVKVEAVSAIACANDSMALGLMEALRERGISVPSDIAVTGFDDIDSGKCAVPPLTTVDQPTAALGREGIRCLVALMNGKVEPRLTRLPATVVARRSCGCTQKGVLVQRRGRGRPGRSLEAALIERRTLIAAELSRSARGNLVGAGSRWEERLLNALLADLSGKEDGAFVAALDRLMAGLHRARAPLAQTQSVLGTLRSALLDCIGDNPEALAKVDDLLDSARELVSEWLVRGETLKRIEVMQLLRDISRASGLLLSGERGLPQRLAFEEHLRHLGFSALSLGLFTEAGKASAQCQCLAGFERSVRARPQPFFRTSDLAPAGVFEHERGALLVQPLLYDREPLGLLTFPLGQHDGSVYEQMRESLAIGLRGYRLAGQAPG